MTTTWHLPISRESVDREHHIASVWNGLLMQDVFHSQHFIWLIFSSDIKVFPFKLEASPVSSSHCVPARSPTGRSRCQVLAETAATGTTE